MPIYEYRCDACGAGHEALQKVSDPMLTECPHCGEARLRKLISAAGFRLSGSGWYETDFKGGDCQRNVAGERATTPPAAAAPAAKATDAGTPAAKPKTETKTGGDGGKGGKSGKSGVTT